MNPKVSVIVAAYNADPYVEDCIYSILNQTWKNIELIIVDDGSKDKTLEKIMRFETNPKVKIISQSNKGQCAATNLAMEYATGDFIQFLDADDILHVQKIERQLNILLIYGNNVTGVSSWARFKDQNFPKQLEHGPPQKELLPLDWICYLWKEGMMPNSGYLIPRPVCDLAGPYNEGLTTNNDFEYFTKIALKSASIVYCDEAITYYRTVSNSLSHAINYTSQQSVLIARKLSCNYLLERYPNEVKAKEAVFYAIWYFIYTYRANYSLLLNASNYLLKNTSSIKMRNLVLDRKFKIMYNLLGIRILIVLMYFHHNVNVFLKKNQK